jgi:RNA polymerase sigma-70 factor (ECF subfamily)
MPPRFVSPPKRALPPAGGAGRAADTRTRAAEAKLIAAARRGDEAALSELVHRVSGPAMRFSMNFCRDPHDAEDLAQDVLATMLRSLGRFRGDASLSTWAYIVAKRSCARLRRRGARQAPLPADSREILDRPDPGAGPHRRLERRQLAEALERAIASLPVPQREVLVLRDVEGLPASQVGRVLGLGERAVKSRLHRARLALRARLAPFVAGQPGRAPGPDCPDTARLLSRHLEGELDPAVCARMEEHVRACPACGDACRSLREVLGACRARGEKPLAGPMQQAVRAAIRRALDEAVALPAGRGNGIDRPARRP